MSTAEILRPAFRPARIVCEQCGTSVDAACNCGAPYVPAGKRAEAAVAREPHKSDRAIAAELGVSQPTVSRARRATDTNVSVAKRVGRDGKARKPPAARMPARPLERVEPAPDLERDPLADQTEKELDYLCGNTDKACRRLEAYVAAQPALSNQGRALIVEYLQRMANKYMALAQELDGRSTS